MFTLKQGATQHLSTKVKSSPPKPLKTTAIFICISFMLASLMLYTGLIKQDEEQIRQEFKIKSNLIEEHFEDIISKEILLLKRMAKRWEYHGGTPHQEWHLDAEQITSYNSIFHAIEWVDAHYIVRWVVPLEGNKNLINLNLSTEKKRKETLTTARNSQKIVITPVVNLYQGGKGFLVYVPLTVEEKFDGFILGVIRVEHLLNSILKSDAFKNFHLSISDGKQQIFSNTTNVNDPYKKWGQTFEINYHNIAWSAEIWPNAFIIAKLKSNLPLYVLLIGLCVSLLLALLIYVIGALRKSSYEVSESAKELELIFLTTSILSDSKDFNEALKLCINMLCEKLNWSVGHAYVFKGDNYESLAPSNIWFVRRSQKESLNEFCGVTQKTNFKLGEGLPGRVWQSKKPAWIADINHDDNSPRANLCQSSPLKGAVGFPIIVQHEVIAVLEFFNTVTQQHDEQLMQVLEVIGDHLGKIWEKRQSQDALVYSEEKNRMILNTAGEGIYGLDHKGCTTFVNPAGQMMLGYTLDELIGQPMHAKIHHHHANGVAYPIDECPMYKTIHEGSHNTINSEVLWRKDGTFFPVEYTSKPIKKGDEIIGAVVTFSDITEKLRIKEQLIRMARYDYLTDLPNRLLYDQTLKNIIDKTNRSNTFFALLTLDLDGFKLINDTMGHDTGDLVLKEVATRLKKSMRSYDFCARLGGDEFAIIAEGLKNQEDACVIAEKIISVINGQYPIEGHIISISTSVGISFYPYDANTQQALIKCSDLALYQAKESGRNQYRVYEG